MPPPARFNAPCSNGTGPTCVNRKSLSGKCGRRDQPGFSSIAATTSALIRPQSTPGAGRTMSGYRILSRSLPVRCAAIAAPMSGQCLSRLAWARADPGWPCRRQRVAESACQKKRPQRKGGRPRPSGSGSAPAVGAPDCSKSFIRTMVPTWWSDLARWPPPRLFSAENRWCPFEVAVP